MASTSSFTEGSSVFGGQANLLQAITNIFAVYNPDVIAVHTTCLSETIGDDIPQIIAKARDEGKIPAGKRVIHTNTPSYVGSHVTGFANMVKSMVDYFAEPAKEKGKTLNLIPGWVEPSDMREIKALAAEIGAETIAFPDTSDVLDAPQTGKHQFYPKGGVTVEQLARTPASQATVALGPTASEAAAQAARRQVQSAVRVAGTAHRLAGDRSLRQHAPPADPGAGAAVDQRPTRPADGHDHRHAPVLPRRARGPVGRSRPTRFAGRVPRRPRHAARLPRHRDAGQAVRKTDRGRPGRPRARSQVSPGPRRRHVPHAPMDQERTGRFADWQYLWQVHRAGTRTSRWCGMVSRSSTASAIRTSPRLAIGGRCGCWK